MRVKLHSGQYRVATDNTRFRVIVAGRRWGKSVVSRMIVYKWALEQPGLYWIVSPTFQQGKDIHWLQGFKQEIIPAHIKKWNDAELSVYLKNGSIISLRSAEHPDRLTGVGLRGLVIDEIASMRNWEWIWDKALRPTLTDYRSKALFISTPKGYNHFFNLAKLGDHDNKIPGTAVDKDGNAIRPDRQYQTFHFTSYDNPYLPKTEVDQAKETLNPDYFAQEYMADFRQYTGLVYKTFNRAMHVIEPFELSTTFKYYRGVDFGSTNPTAVVWVAVDEEDNWYVYDEYYETSQTIDHHAGVINAKSRDIPFEATYGDPSGVQWIKEFSTRGVFISAANKERGTALSSWVRLGIDKLAERIKPIPGREIRLPDGRYFPQPDKGLPKLFIFKNCTNLIYEFEHYRWKERKSNQAMDINEPDVPEKANDHALDALRYIAVSYGKAEHYKTPKDDLSEGNWSLI